MLFLFQRLLVPPTAVLISVSPLPFSHRLFHDPVHGEEEEDKMPGFTSKVGIIERYLDTERLSPDTG